MTTQTTVVINSMGLERKDRTTSRGTSSRYVVTIKASPIVLDFSAKALGREPAEAMRQHLSDSIKGIGEAVKPATANYRRRALDAFRSGAPWAMRRYSGGRTGAKPPDPTKARVFNDSGRLADGIFVRDSGDDSWTVNVPANRFDPTTFNGGLAAMIQMVERLQQLVPAFGNADRMAEVPEVQEAIVDTLYKIGIRDEAKRTKSLAAWRRRRRSGLDGIRDAARILGNVADLLRAGGLTI